MTDKPFGVNLLMQNPDAAQLVKVVIEQKYPLFLPAAAIRCR